MGTIAEKGAYTIETKSLLKQKINNLGGSIDDNTTFRQYANQLQNVYDNLPKTEYQEGTEINLGKTIKGKLDFENGVVGIGQASQDSTQGYQLINPSQLPLTTNGVTISKDTKGNIVLNGTPSISEGYINFTYSAYINLSPNTYTLSVANKKVGIGIIVSSSEFGGALNLTFADTSKSKSKAISNNTSTDVQVNVRYDVGTLDNFILNPMLESGSTAHEYEQYTGGQASPNPSYPQDIEVVRGKNRCDGKFRQGGWGGTSSNRLFTTQNYPIKEGEEFTLSTNLNTTIYKYGVQIGSSPYPQSSSAGIIYDSGWITTKPFTFIASVSGYLGITVAKANGTDDISVDDISGVTWQLEEGSTSTPYLPYNTIEEVVSGKNLWGLGTRVNGYCAIFNGGVWTGTDDTISSFYFEISKLPDQVTFKIDNGNRANVSYYNTLPMGTTNVANSYEATSYTTLPRTINVNKQYKYVFIQVTYGVDKDLLVNGQMESGDTLGTYEPYITPTSYQLSLGDIELNAIGNYRDELIYDVDEDKVYKNEKIGETTFNNVRNLYQEVAFGVNKKYFFQTIATAKNLGNPAYNFYCEVLSKSNGVANDYTGFFNGNNIVVFLNDSDTTTTATEKYSGKSLLYVLNTPTLIEITDQTLINQVKALYNAQSNNGTTIITSNGNLPIVLKVRGLKGE